MRTSDWSSDVCSSDLLADDHVLAIDRNAAELLLVAGVAHAVRGGAGAQHGQRGVRAEAEHLRVADAGLLADTDRHAGVGVAAVDAGNILLVQVDAVGGVGGHRHARQGQWRHRDQLEGTLLGLDHSGSPDGLDTRPASCRPLSLSLLSNDSTAAPSVGAPFLLLY